MRLSIFSTLSAAAFIVLAAVLAGPLKAETIFLKDGTIIDGSILSDTGTSVTIRNSVDNKVKQYPSSSVMRIQFSKLKMSKIYIQKRDGEGIVAYMVDEDDESYTFRMEILKPAEFKLNRSDVLFMAEKNPSGLKVDGVIGTDRVALVWLPPYDAVKKYNIYIKKKKEDNYVLAGSTGGKSLTLKDLSSSTTYYLIAKSVDSDDYESSPSNELVITTSARVSVMLKDGTVFSSYLVKQDKSEYYFRRSLSDKEERAVKRQDIQYITERFPNALRGTAGTDRIDLTWFSPYDAMKEYTVYVKKAGGQYAPAGKTGNTEYTLKDLSSRTEYIVKVSGTGMSGEETAASNELKIPTKNILPDKPHVKGYDLRDSGEWVFSWNDVTAHNGRIAKYRIYAVKEDKRNILAEQTSTEYALKDRNSFKKVEIAAVDDIGEESPFTNIKLSEDTCLGFNTGVLIPLGSFGKMSNIGYGGMLTLAERNLFVKGFESGLGAGCYYAGGKDLTFQNSPSYDRFLIAPLCLNTGYRLTFLKNFSVMPYLSFGAAYFNMTYSSYDPFTLEKQNIADSFIDPMAKCGLSMEYRITRALSISVFGEYGAFIEKSGAMPFVISGAAFEYRF